MLKKLSNKDKGVCIILQNSRGEVLLGKRIGKYMNGYFGLPGGGVDEGEDIADSAQRELMEEAGIRAMNLEFIGIVKEVREKGDYFHHVFLCREYEGSVTLAEPDKCEGWEWHSLEAIPEYTVPGHLSAIHLYTQRVIT